MATATGVRALNRGGVGENGPMSADKSEADAAAEETKRKFREALAAKQGRRGEDHLDAGTQPVQPHGPVETKRTFRRKTG